MASDLLDAYEALDWAETKIQAVIATLSDFRRSNAYTTVIEADSKPGYKVLKLRTNGAPPPFLNAEAGAIINTIRSSLDILACALAVRAGCVNPKSTYFPIVEGPSAFVRDKKGRIEKINRLSESDQAAIEQLKPYNGGHPHLYRLHKLDVMRKHRRLIKITPHLHNASLVRFDNFDEPIEVLFTGKLEDNTPLWRFAAGSNAQAKVSIDITFDETPYAVRENIGVTLLGFLRSARTIIEGFDGTSG